MVFYTVANSFDGERKKRNMMDGRISTKSHSTEEVFNIKFEDGYTLKFMLDSLDSKLWVAWTISTETSTTFTRLFELEQQEVGAFRRWLNKCYRKVKV